MTLPSIGPLLHRHRYLCLLIMLLLVIGAGPFTPSSLRWLPEAMMFLALAAGGWATARTPRMSLCLGVLGSLAITIRVVFWLTPEDGRLAYGFLVGYSVFFTVVAVHISRSLFDAGTRIDTDTLCGALSVYLILGLIWSMIYMLLEATYPGSFSFGSRATTDEDYRRFFGFSFTTLTTLGYGNVAPATARADALTTLQAIAGQIYLAVVIARFVALQLVQGGSAANAPQ